jgi:glycosyltransferase involved in cell wall biosynthesis
VRYVPSLHVQLHNVCVPSSALSVRPPIFAIIPCPDPITGGVQADLKIVEQLRARGWTVDIVYFADGRNAAPRFNSWDQLAFNVRLIRRFRGEPPGFIVLEDQALSSAVAVFNYFVQKRRRARVALLTYHLVFNLWRNPIRRFTRRLIEGSVARGVDLTIVSSQSTRREVEALGVSAERIKVVRLGPRSLSHGPASPSVPDDERIVRLLSVGTVEPRKGLEYLLRALSELSDCSWQLDLLGDFDAQHHAFLEKLARSIHVADRVRFHGRVVDSVLEDFMSRAHVYVSPSLGEGFGLAVLEAMERGLPVVATQAGALPELVQNERTGLLVPPRNPSALAAALRRTIVDPDLRQRLGQSAQDAVKDRYSWEETGIQVEAALVALCDVHES